VTEEHRRLIQISFEHIVPITAAAELFYSRPFELDPGLQQHFAETWPSKAAS
jgi:hypothetical protein